MTAKTQMKIVVLFEDELRLAAKALEAAYATHSREDATDSETDLAWGVALRACMAALAGAEDDHMALVLSRKPDPMRQSK